MQTHTRRPTCFPPQVPPPTEDAYYSKGDHAHQPIHHHAPHVYHNVDGTEACLRTGLCPADVVSYNSGYLKKKGLAMCFS